MKNKIKILFICPGGQTKLNSPSELLAKFINDNYDYIDITIYNQTFNRAPNTAKGYDLVWGDMDGHNVPQIALSLSSKSKIPCYIHAEWIPPYRWEKGWSDYFNEPTNLSQRKKYQLNIDAMKEADLVSLAIDKTPGGFEFIKERTGIIFKNSFVRYPACKKYDFINTTRKNQISTIARANDGKKRIKDTMEAIHLSKSKPIFKIIGGINIKHKDVTVKSMGSFNEDHKVNIFAESKLSVQHWSGIPPAESIQQFCPVVSYDIPYMRELYGDSLIWVEKDNVQSLSETIDYWMTHDEEREEFAKKAFDLFTNNKLGVKLEKYRAELLIEKIKTIL